MSTLTITPHQAPPFEHPQPGLDPDQWDFGARSSCGQAVERGQESFDLWQEPEDAGSTARALRYCAGCAVMLECAARRSEIERALATQMVGVWGGQLWAYAEGGRHAERV